MREWLSRYSLQKKLLTALGIGLIGFMLYFAANLIISHHYQQILNQVIEEYVPMLETTERLSRSLNAVKTSVMQSAFDGSIDSIGVIEQANGEVRTAFEALHRTRNEVSPDLEQMRARYEATYKGCTDSLQNVVAGIEKLDAVQRALHQYSLDLGALEIWAVELKQKQTGKFHGAIEEVNSGSRKSAWAGWILIIGAIPFALAFSWLTRTATADLQFMSSRLAEVSRNMLQISGDTSRSSSELATASGRQSTGVVESMSSMEQMKTKLAQTVTNSSEALRSAEESLREAAAGRVVVDNLNTAMAEIARSQEELEEVKEIVRQIRDKTNVINEIVFKTQILSFNASIEAARAGQHGRGFAVVASEVGKLAEVSGHAAQEIDKLLDTSSKKVAEIIGSTKDKVGMANEMSQNCSRVFERLTSRASQVKGMVNSISDAATEQESGILLVVRAMSEMSESAGDTDKMAHTIAHRSQLLKGHAQELARSVEGLDAIVHGRESIPSNQNPPAGKPLVAPENTPLAKSA